MMAAEITQTTDGMVVSSDANLSNPALWVRIEALSLDVEGAALPFSARLARENGWTPEFAARVVEEYRRFAYLSQVSEGSVTPSDEVDQAWHLHLLYTRHYWGAFTAALDKPLHHGPTEGGQAEGAKYRSQYAETLALYRREFGTEPPADVWPSEAVRFGKAPTARRVLEADYLVIKKPKRELVWGAGAALVGALALPTVGFAHGPFPSDVSPANLLHVVEHWFTEHTVYAVTLSAFIIWGGFIASKVIGGAAKAKGAKSGAGGTGWGASAGDSSSSGDGGGSSGCGSGCGGCGG